MALAVGVLGPVLVTVDGEPVSLLRARERTVLAALALAHPEPVPADALGVALWGVDGTGASATIRSHVSRLRSAIGTSAIRSGRTGYALDLPGDGLDVARFDAGVDRAEAALRAGHWTVARTTAEAALALWRGDPLPELADGRAEAVRVRLRERRRTGTRVLAEALLASGEPDAAAAALSPACADAPLDEHLWALLVRALAAAGRRDEALLRLDEVRGALARELGMDPGEQLRAAHDAVVAATPPPRRGRMRVRYAPHGDRSLCHAVLGDAGPPLLLLHGMFMPCEMLVEEPGAAAFLDRLGTGHRLVVMDLGGLGLSDAVPPDELSVEGWAADAAAVLDHVRLGPAAVIGCGPSAAVALHLAAARPDLVSRLALAGVPLLGPWDDTPLEAVLDHVDRATGSGEAVRWLAPSRAGDRAFSEWLDRGGERGAPPAVARAFFHMLYQLDLADLVARTAVPTLVIDRPDASADGRWAEEVVALLPDGHRFTQPGTPDVLPFASGMAAWVDAVHAFVDGEPVPAGRLMVVAATAVAGAPPEVSAHDLPAQAVAAATERLRRATGPCRAVVHAGEVLVGGPSPSGPAVAHALEALSAAPPGVLARTPAFEAVAGPAGSPQPDRAR
jgi:DNA-binding SARP family transcriptional activator/pimeloyl-ACP methyl ester carboxylesterase